MTSFQQWLSTIGLSKYGAIFEEQNIDFDVARSLADEDLRELGLKLGDRRRFLSAAAGISDTDLKAGASAPPQGLTEGRSSGNGVAPHSGERRQLSVMFVDLVGSTALSDKLDPEDVQSLLDAYRTLCRNIVVRYDGFIAQYLGDGILTYFGWPTAHEEDAERAVRAALDIVRTVQGASVTEVLSVRIGIASGTVVVGAHHREGEEPAQAVGSTPNIAARLQGLAESGQIIVSGSTRRLVGSAFSMVDLGDHALKGIAEPIHAWRIEHAFLSQSRFEVRRAGSSLTPLVGREQEIGLLLDRFQLTRGGEGQIVMLSGEPGIGKSRIVSEFQERLEAQNVHVLRFQCSPFHINTEFWPSIDGLERLLALSREGTPELKLDRLEAYMVDEHSRPLADVRFIASMMSIPSDSRYGAISITPQQHKDETCRALVDLAESTARKRTTVVIYEDVHWADPTSIELLEEFVSRVATIPLLVVLTHRPEFENRWLNHGHVLALSLAKLTHSQSGVMIANLCGGKALPGDLAHQMQVKADGIPLFVEELIKSVLESGELMERADRYVFAGAARGVRVPETLKDSLMARLDRLAHVKDIAQIGAAIGREFKSLLSG